VSAIGESLLWAAALLTLVTGYDYLVAGLRHINQPRQARPLDCRKSEHPA
jgi:cardiolipin synthase